MAIDFPGTDIFEAGGLIRVEWCLQQEVDECLVIGIAISARY